GGTAMLIGRGATKRGVTSTSAEAPLGTTDPSAWRSELPLPKPQHFDLQEIPSFPSGVPLRPMDRDVFAPLWDPKLKREDLADLFPDRPYKVRVVGSVEEHLFGAVLVDNDRDGKWDERWVLKGDQVIRTLPPNQQVQGGDPTHFTLAHGRWQPH